MKDNFKPFKANLHDVVRSMSKRELIVAILFIAFMGIVLGFLIGEVYFADPL